MPSAGELIRRLRRAGFVLVKHGKKHDVYEHQNGRRIVVWRHKGKEIPTGTYRAILRDAGIGADD